ncbi:MAG: efflux RND transporter periplasmic adaptor subunit [Geobacteraceae bacterium]|nr:efflux RND transporter periplasmic adaptor subunit [Geobacteraceae bacterium]
MKPATANSIPFQKSPVANGISCTRRFPILLLALCVLISACSGSVEKPKPKPPVPVTIGVSMRKTVPVQIRIIGSVESISTVSIKSQVNGMLEKVHFREGDDVSRGALLFSIDSRPYEAALRQAKAALSRDVAQEKFARDQARRYGGLLKDGIVTQDQYEQLRTNADALAESVRADRAMVDNAVVLLGYCFIRSPIDGRTGNLMVQRGNLVKANDVPILVTINQINPIYVTFSVPEKELSEIKKHMALGNLKVEALIPNDPGPAEQGVISFLDNMVDSTTGTIKVKGTFANKQKRLWPGQFVNVVLTLATIPNAVVVPSQAVQTGQDGLFVFVVKQDRTVELRPVVTNETYNGETVIEKGLNPGETVVTDGQLQLSPGTRVTYGTENSKDKVTRQ